MSKRVIHKIDRDEWSEYAAESETIMCDQLDRLSDPMFDSNWFEVTCKKCLRYKPCHCKNGIRGRYCSDYHAPRAKETE